jgi:GTP cyclohydrolase I
MSQKAKHQNQPINSDAIKEISKNVASILKALKLDIKNPDIADTPMRVAKMFVNETCSSLFNEPPKCTVFKNPGYDQIIWVEKITINSMCEHHLVPFIGTVSIAYKPTDSILGLSKFTRVARYFASKPQVQERLTQEIGNYLQKVLKNDDVAVLIECQHLCCSIRGVLDPNQTTKTSFLGGAFRSTFKNEFYAGLKNK